MLALLAYFAIAAVSGSLCFVAGTLLSSSRIVALDDQVARLEGHLMQSEEVVVRLVSTLMEVRCAVELSESALSAFVDASLVSCSAKR